MRSLRTRKKIKRTRRKIVKTSSSNKFKKKRKRLWRWLKSARHHQKLN